MSNVAELSRSWNTARLQLRPFRLTDADGVLAYARDEEWAKFLPVPQPYTAGDAEWFVARQLLADHQTAPRWALEHEGELCGSVELSLDHAQGVASLHYALARTRWGKGLMTEAVRSVIGRVFAELPHVMRIDAWADVRNVGSCRVMEKCGLVREGIHRSCRVVHGARVDDAHHALLRSDWVA